VNVAGASQSHGQRRGGGMVTNDPACTLVYDLYLQRYYVLCDDISLLDNK